MTVARGALVVFTGLVGVILVIGALPRFRRPVLARRLTPYLAALDPRRSALLGAAVPAVGVGAVLAPLRDAVAVRLHRLLDDGLELPARLEAAGRAADVSAFRAEQVTWGLTGLVGGVALGLLALGAGRSVSPILLLALAGAFAATGVMARDRALTRAIERRRAAARAALPTVVDLLCLAVTAGESLRGALGLVAEAGENPVADEVRAALRDARGGTPLVDALGARARLLGDASFDRLVDAVSASQERGIPLADTMRSLAFDLREHDKRRLVELAGRKQISMLVPVITLILPVAIVFAFYPGVVAIRTLAR